MTDYSTLDRVLHRLALQSSPMAELIFDIDQSMVRTDPGQIVGERHVFISGLARAGTTILMRRFHASGAFRSLTYRDMPFVLAPNLWRKFSGGSKRQIAAAERAHGDGILVNADSPESFDEAFWRAFAGKQYIHPTHLQSHEPDSELVSKFVAYINAVLAAQDEAGTRYLSKNNNNILRLPAIRRAFPGALVLVPFREPMAHAGSLLRQHRHFSTLQAEDSFTRAYMTWLAHHEFGLEHRPFRSSAPEDFVPSSFDPDAIEYWLELWCSAYDWLMETAPDGTIFVCYEDLCSKPETWARLADLAGIETGDESEEPFRLGIGAEAGAADAALAERAAALYARLVERARSY